MDVTRSTTANEFIEATKWHISGPQERDGFTQAFDFFLRNIPTDRLNDRDTSSPWTPGSGPRTLLISWLQGIYFGERVNPNRSFTHGRLKQFRNRQEKLGVQGNWFTFESTRVSTTGLPDGQDSVRIYEVVSPIVCLESTAADVYAGWNPSVPPRYAHGGARQLFIDNKGPYATSLRLVGGAKPIK
jgi:hypothetical protein